MLCIMYVSYGMREFVVLVTKVVVSGGKTLRAAPDLPLAVDPFPCSRITESKSRYLGKVLVLVFHGDDRNRSLSIYLLVEQSPAPPGIDDGRYYFHLCILMSDTYYCRCRCRHCCAIHLCIDDALALPCWMTGVRACVQLSGEFNACLNAKTKRSITM